MIPVMTENPEGVTTAEFSVEGMHCGSCAALIEETLIENPSIPAVSVDLDAARATVTFDPTRVSVDDVAAEITKVGYPATLASA
jgi:copper chaperone CopZ